MSKEATTDARMRMKELAAQEEAWPGEVCRPLPQVPMDVVAFEPSPTKPGGSRVQRRARAAQMRGKA